MIPTIFLSKFELSRKLSNFPKFPNSVYSFLFAEPNLYNNFFSRVLPSTHGRDFLKGRENEGEENVSGKTSELN